MATAADSCRRLLAGRPDGILPALQSQPLSTWGVLVVVTCTGAAAYGAVIGSWNGGRMALFAAVKLPAVLLLTAALTWLCNAVTAALLGLRLRLAAVGALTFLALAVAAVLLASLAPAALVLTRSAPSPGTTARTAHNLLYLLHTALVGGSGRAGSAVRWRSLRRLTPAPATARRVYAAWLLAFAVVGGEVAWALRPFVGSIYLPVTFLREDALEGNVYEFVWTDIVPYLATTLREETR
jgi:hypothetical protein